MGELRQVGVERPTQGFTAWHPASEGIVDLRKLDCVAKLCVGEHLSELSICQLRGGSYSGREWLDDRQAPVMVALDRGGVMDGGAPGFLGGGPERRCRSGASAWAAA